MHYYKFRIADYRKDTQHLTRNEHYIYRELIDWYYLEETPIPLDPKIAMRRLRLQGQEDENHLAGVLADFFERHEDGWHIPKIDEEIAAYQENAEKNKSNGIKGGRPTTKPKRNPMGSQTEPKRNPSVTLTTNHESETINHKPETSSINPLIPPEGFDDFWKVFPKQRAGSRDKAAVAYKKALGRAAGALINSKAAEYAMSDEVARGYAKGAAAWLNDDRWTHEYRRTQNLTDHERTIQIGLDYVHRRTEGSGQA